MEELKIKAPAKINLHLEVLRKRDDGFHDISSIFTLIDLYDSLNFKRSEGNISLKEQTPITVSYTHLTLPTILLV